MSLYLFNNIYWGHYFYISYWEMGLPSYVAIQAWRRSSHLQGKSSTFISQSF